jgi:hypothetical protein
MRLTSKSAALVLIALAVAVVIGTACAMPATSDQPANNQKMSDKPSTPTNNAPVVSTPNADHVQQGIEGLDFNSGIKLDRTGGKPRLIINYTVMNRGKSDVLLFNQGDVNNPGSATVYIEPRPDGVVEISKKGFMPPDNPSPTFIVYPGATRLGPGKSFSDKIELTLSYLTRKHPYAASVSGIAMPDPVRKVRFCLGASPSEGVETKTVGEGRRKILVPDIKGLAQQRLLCSDVQEIQ